MRERERESKKGRERWWRERAGEREGGGREGGERGGREQQQSKLKQPMMVTVKRYALQRNLQWISSNNTAVAESTDYSWALFVEVGDTVHES